MVPTLGSVGQTEEVKTAAEKTREILVAKTGVVSTPSRSPMAYFTHQPRIPNMSIIRPTQDYMVPFRRLRLPQGGLAGHDLFELSKEYF